MNSAPSPSIVEKLLSLGCCSIRYRRATWNINRRKHKTKKVIEINNESADLDNDLIYKMLTDENARKKKDQLSISDFP